MDNNAVEKELLARVVDSFPHSIEIFAPDGTAVLVNKALLAECGNVSPDMVVGKYNIFTDPDVIGTGLIDAVKQAFDGETVCFQDVRVPLESLAERYGVQDMDVEALYQDITLFPVPDEQNRVAYVVALMVTRRVYRGRDEIARAREYIETHWQEDFDLGAVAGAAGLSKAHFAKLFKKHTGLTPYEYYINYKIGKVKEKLLDVNITVAQAFAACNMDYNGHWAGIFRKKTGLSPSAYRKMMR